MNTKLRLLLGSFLKLYFILSTNPAHTQALPFGGRLFGENIVDEVTSPPNSGYTLHGVATSNSVYFRRYADAGIFFYTKIWTAPPPRTIRSIAFKLGTPPVCPGSGGANYITLILLDNGEIYMFSSCFNSSQNSFINIGVTESWNKMKGDALYALSSQTIYVSYDNGFNWSSTNTGLGAAHINDFDMDSAFAMIYAGTSAGLFRKDTLPGTPWAFVNSFVGTTNVFRVYLDRLNRILAGGNGSGLWKSIDNGNSWVVDTTGLGPNGTLTEFGDDKYNNLYGAGLGKLYKSPNGNQPWQRIDAGILALAGTTPFYTAVVGDSILSAATNFGNFLSSDQGNTWIKADSGIAAQNYFGLSRLGNGKVFASTSLGIHANNPGDSNWVKSYPQSGYSGSTNVFADNIGVLYGLDNSIAHPNNTPTPIIKSTDQGQTWTVDTAGLSAINGNLFYIDETGTQHYSNTLFGSSFLCRLWKRNPPGAWTQDISGFPAVNNSFVSSMVSDKNCYLYVSGSFSNNKLMRRPIMGGNWVVDTAGLGTVNRFTMMTAGKNGSVIGSNGSVLKQRVAGNWNTIPLPPPLSGYTISAIAVDSSGKLFVAFKTNNNLGKGVYYSGNYEASWILVGLDSINVSQLIPYNDTVYALTLGFGAYKLVAAAGPALPIKLISFSASNQGSENLLKWKTENEYNSSHFEIERSVDGSYFLKIGSLGSSNTSTVTDYSFIDPIPLRGNNYYRLKMIDRDGKFSYSKIEKVYVEPGSFIKIWPNPSSGQYTITGMEPGQTYMLNVFDLNGKLVKTERATGRQSYIDLGNLARGFYFLRIDSDREHLFFKLLKD